MIDLGAYFARIGFEGDTRPSRATLDALQHAHVQSIPFENLDVLLGRRIDLNLEAIENKLVRGGRGGYCFEQNTLLMAVLQQLGFSVRPLSARVRYQRPRDHVPPRTHLFLGIELEGETWFADVGVGGLSPTAALRFREAEEQTTPHEPRRILREQGAWFHQVRFPDGWHDLYEFTMEEMPPIDREVGNWYTSAHPESHFRNRLLVARASHDGGRLTLLNREFTVRTPSGASQTRVLESEAELRGVLAEHFGISLPAGTHLECAALDWPAQPALRV